MDFSGRSGVVDYFQIVWSCTLNNENVVFCDRLMMFCNISAYSAGFVFNCRLDGFDDKNVCG